MPALKSTFVVDVSFLGGPYQREVEATSPAEAVARAGDDVAPRLAGVAVAQNARPSAVPKGH